MIGARDVMRGKTAVFPPQTIRLVWQAGLFLVLFLLFFGYVQYGAVGLAGNDGYYHMKMGYLMRQEGLTPTFDVLPYTILNEADYYDHHLLYHAYLALFATTDPAIDGGVALTQGAKLASMIMPSLAFLVAWWLLRGQGVPGTAVYTLALFAISQAFLYRMSMPRAQSLALLLLLLGLHWLLQGHYKRLIPLGFVFVWAYNAFPLLLLVGGAYLLTMLLLERRLVWQAVAYPAVGILLGLLINPYFPQDFIFIYHHLLPKIGESATRVGNEWSPYQTWTLVENSGYALAAFVLGIFGLAWRKDRADKATLVTLLLALLFGFMLFKSRRFIEYFPPFALLFAAFSLAPLLREATAWLQKRGVAPVLPLILALGLLTYPLVTTLNEARTAVSDTKAADHFADAALWLHHNTPPDSFIFQTDWDDFTRLFFYHSDAVYTAGLDPTFMELYNPDLFALWRDITQGRVAQPSTVIRQQFGGDYVFSDLNHDNFLAQAAQDPDLVEVYRDEYAVIFAVK